ncbi:MAG: HPr family phosphocarrier protein [Rhodospirillaceae bacterium]|nr:HPr family phosphocarrier protein [Rhodospirillaceae bacterium]|tara:strand:+ start:824 stop:1111 length:288 start_codon:yes stop_codon:yes gene_type:complete
MKDALSNGHERTLVIQNKRGLHARAAAKFVNAASEFDSQVTVSKENETVSGKSIMGLLMLVAVQGSNIRITALGKDAVEAVETLTELVDNKFDED